MPFWSWTAKQKLKKYKPTLFRAKDSNYSKEAADYAMGFFRPSGNFV
ncbi:MAG: hypothetical protein HFF66_10450 [Oscillospiraceae bacterium]|nr:hypothetical protein [Oscillospiraceae bacterium]